jgi:hypothetical protein
MKIRSSKNVSSYYRGQSLECAKFILADIERHGGRNRLWSAGRGRFCPKIPAGAENGGRMKSADNTRLMLAALAEELQKKPNTIGRTARRHKDQFLVLAGGKVGLFTMASAS